MQVIEWEGAHQRWPPFRRTVTDLPWSWEADVRSGEAEPGSVFVQGLILFFQMSWAQQNPKHIFSALRSIFQPMCIPRAV